MASLQNKRWSMIRRQPKSRRAPDKQTFQLMFEHHSAIMLLIDPETGVILDANSAAVNFYGHSKAKLCGMPIHEINALPPEQVAAEHQKVADAERNYFIFPHRLASGEERIVEVHSSPIALQEKQILFSIIHDITERKQAEEQSLLQNLILNATANAIMLSDRDGAIKWANLAFSMLTGYTLEESINKNPRELVKSGRHDLDLYKKMWGTILSGKVWQGEVINRRKNGSLYTEEMTITPLKDADGVINHFIAIKQDISERKRMEEALRESDRFAHSIVDTLIEKIVILNENGSIVAVNRAWRELADAKVQEPDTLCEGANYLEVCDAALGPDAAYAMSIAVGIRAVINSEQSVFSLEYPCDYLVGSDIEVHWFRAKVTRFTGDGPVRVVIAHEDITTRKQADEQLRASEERYRLWANNLPDIIYSLDKEGNIVTINSSAFARYGYTEQDSKGKPFLNFIHPEDREIVIKSFLEAIQQQRKFTHGLRFRIVAGNGCSYWFELNSQARYDVHGGYLGEDGVLRDITERKQMDERLRESEEKHRTFIEQSSECITLVDELGNIIEWNHAREELTGLKREDVLGKPYWEIRLQLSPPEMRTADVLQRFKSITLEMLQAGQSPQFNRIHEGELVTASGERKFVAQIAFPVKTKNGYCIGSVLSDITERKRVGEALKQSEAHYHLLADHMTDKIWLMDMNLKLTYVSPSVEKRRGYTFDELQQLPLEQNLAPASFQMVMKVFAEEMPKVLADPSYSLDRTLELAFCEKDGSTFLEETKLSIIRDENGTPVSILGEGRDITERKQAEDALRASEEKYRLIAENTSDGIIIFGADNQIQYVSHAYTNQLGYSEVEELGRTPEDIYSVIHADDREAVFANIYQAIELKKTELAYSYRVKHKAGHYIWREDNAKFIYDQSGNYLGSNVICRDITERKQSEESIFKRVQELETINRISLAMRGTSEQVEMLSKVLDEILAILNTSHGSIELFSRTMKKQDKTLARGWMVQVTEPAVNKSDDLTGRVLTKGEIYTSREFASDPRIRREARSQIPPGWGGATLPIRTTERALGVLTVCVPSERELDKDEIRLLSILSDMIGAALQRMQLHTETVRRLEHLQALHAVDQAISSSHDLRLTLNILMMQAKSQLTVDAVDVFLLQPDSNLVQLAAHRGFHTLLIEKFSLDNSVSGRAVLEHRSVFALDIESAVLRENPKFEKLWKEEGFVCYWCVPLIVKGEIKGFMEVYRRTIFSAEAEWLEFLETLASQAAIAIDNTQLFETLQRANQNLSLAYDATIEGWSRAMDLRDHETEGHTLRVTDLTVKLARAMHISEFQLSVIRRGTLLHDIGKIGVPDDILLKAGPLTEEEWVVMRKHPQYAYDMLAPIAYLKDSIDIPYCHHEKWDGTGYPQGLQGEQIPLGARIFAIVDVWDALTSDRPYRKKWTEQKTRLHIQQQSGKYFDPQIVNVFLKTI